MIVSVLTVKCGLMRNLTSSCFAMKRRISRFSYASFAGASAYWTIGALLPVALKMPPSRHGVMTRSAPVRSEEHTSELQSLMRISYAVFCLKKKKQTNHKLKTHYKNTIKNIRKT